jgi:putative ABC transport system permease protein
MHFSSLHDDSVKPENIWMLLALAAGVLLIACINFTTLAIGRSAGRAREVGIRKVVGSSKKNLIIQFLTEAVFLSAISVIIGFLLARLFLPWFNQLSGSTLTFSFSQFPKVAWMLIPLTLIVGIVAGSYPALILSAFEPVEVLKNKVRLGGSNLFTKSLVSFQFILSTGLIISTFIVLQQLHFLHTKDPGFNKENVVVVEATDMDIKRIYPLYRQAVLAHPEIKSTASSELGLGEGAGRAGHRFEYYDKDVILVEYNVDADYLPLMGIPLIAGRNFDKNISDDTVRSIIINKAMMNSLGWTLQNVIGQPLAFYGPDSIYQPVVIGVIKDFHFGSFREEDKPQMFMQFPRLAPTPMWFEYRKFFIRIRPGEPSKALAILENEWKKVVPDLPFKYSFLDEDIDRYYQSDIRFASILSWAGGISVFLACLGLFGLASLAAVNRTKEIGIRKVVGAPVARIVWLISADFVRLVIIALLIASPITWYYMNQWLQDFVYRITISWWVFVICGLIAVLISIITISIHAIKAAIASPVKSLRTE